MKAWLGLLLCVGCSGGTIEAPATQPIVVAGQSRSSILKPTTKGVAYVASSGRVVELDISLRKVTSRKVTCPKGKAFTTSVGDGVALICQGYLRVQDGEEFQVVELPGFSPAANSWELSSDANVLVAVSASKIYVVRFSNTGAVVSALDMPAAFIGSGQPKIIMADAQAMLMWSKLGTHLTLDLQTPALGTACSDAPTDTDSLTVSTAVGLGTDVYFADSASGVRKLSMTDTNCAANRAPLLLTTTGVIAGIAVDDVGSSTTITLSRLSTDISSESRFAVYDLPDGAAEATFVGEKTLKDCPAAFDILPGKGEAKMFLCADIKIRELDYITLNSPRLVYGTFDESRSFVQDPQFFSAMIYDADAAQMVTVWDSAMGVVDWFDLEDGSMQRSKNLFLEGLLQRL